LEVVRRRLERRLGLAANLPILPSRAADVSIRL
jgi:hypothetical protein